MKTEDIQTIQIAIEDNGIFSVPRCKNKGLYRIFTIAVYFGVIHNVVAGTACQRIVTKPGIQYIVTVSAQQNIVAVMTVQFVITAAAGEHIIPLETIQGIVARFSREPVITGTAKQHIILAATTQTLGPGQPDNPRKDVLVAVSLTVEFKLNVLVCLIKRRSIIMKFSEILLHFNGFMITKRPDQQIPA